MDDSGGLKRQLLQEGTKGGRGRRIDRWVPDSATALEGLQRAAAVQGEARKLVPH